MDSKSPWRWRDLLYLLRKVRSTFTVTFSPLAIEVTLSYGELADVINLHPRDGGLEIADVEHQEAVVIHWTTGTVELDEVDTLVLQETIVIRVLDTTVLARAKSHNVMVA